MVLSSDLMSFLIINPTQKSGLIVLYAPEIWFMQERVLLRAFVAFVK